MPDQQLGFADAFADPRMRAAGKLAGLAEVIDWGPVDALADRLREEDRGRPPYRAAGMLRALYLQALYDLSDPGLEEALLVRLDFRAFCVRNRLITPRRAPVEAIFGTLKRTYGRARARFCGLTRTAADLMRVLTVYNLRRAIALQAA